jgi:hypothetical protein
MKKLLVSWILGLAALGMWATPSHAFHHTFGLFVHHGCCGHCCGCCCSTICVRPYNAFSPVCCGTLCCDGCNPFCCAPTQACAYTPECPAVGNPGYSAAPSNATLPSCDGGTPAPGKLAPTPIANPGPGAFLMPYNNSAPMMGQPVYWSTGYGR